MNAQLWQVASEPLPASRKVYKPGGLHPGLRVPMREIALPWKKAQGKYSAPAATSPERS